MVRRHSVRRSARTIAPSVDALLKNTAQATLLERNRLLARSIRYRSAYLDPLNHIQIELLKRHRAGETSRCSEVFIGQSTE